MEDESTWESYPISHFTIDVSESKSMPEEENDLTEEDISLDSLLPEDILERILSFLPVASVFRAASVRKRWYDIIHSRRSLWANMPPQKPWYFMFTCNESPSGFTYDPILRKWYNLLLPCIEKSDWLISSSCGLVCSMDNENSSRIFVCNPITRNLKRLIEPPGVKFPDYSTLAISVDRVSHRYTVVVAKTKQVPDDFLQWSFSIQIYESERGSWATPVDEVLIGWRGGNESVICRGVFYCLIHSTGVLGNSNPCYQVITYDLSSGPSRASLMRSVIPVPCPLTCGRLMNLKNTLVMVGGLAKYERPDVIKGICIWELMKGRWREVAKMPHRFFQGFGELDDVFATTGSDEILYIQCYGAPALCLFDVRQRQWKWSVKCPVSKRFPLQLFTGFCFEPRLDISS